MISCDNKSVNGRAFNAPMNMIFLARYLSFLCWTLETFTPSKPSFVSFLIFSFFIVLLSNVEIKYKLKNSISEVYYIYLFKQNKLCYNKEFAIDSLISSICLLRRLVVKRFLIFQFKANTSTMYTFLLRESVY